MTEEIEDALISAVAVTTRAARSRLAGAHIADHPKAVGLFTSESSSVIEFKAKLKAFLGEVDGTLTVSELLDELS